MTDRDSARQQIADLVARFAATTPAARARMNETQLRHSYVLPLFQALGWNISDPAQMTAEESISNGRADFGFYVGRVPAFYVETKRVNAGVSRPEQIKQAIGYAYLKGVAWAVLTHFEELSVYSASADAPPERARFLHLHWETYATSGFDDLWLLSREAMAAASRPIDRLGERYGAINPRRPVTDLLFENLSEWRSRLYNQFWHFQPPLVVYPAHEVDNAVQKLLDRLIFLRTAEDRKLEQGWLNQIVRQHKPGEWWPRLKALFREMNEVYNSNLFAPHTLDNFDLNDPDLLRTVIDGLYRYNSNLDFDFSAIDADVLGAAYEQYLGHKQRATIAETDETRARQRKRKQHGIFYTPKAIVRYIVDQTLGRRLRDGADPFALRVVDPACGSGSFLIAAFDALDGWIARTQPGLPDVERRRRILTECLYGVDLDDQAVEITRLNLVLRASLERARLPMLHHIQQGDSLVSDAAVTPTPFIWRNRFAEVLDGGGFDVVLGNPPYVRGELQSAAFKAFAAEHYSTAVGGADLYVYFMEHSLRLLKPDGVYGVIVANKWMRAGYGEKLRGYLRPHVREIVDFGDLPVFADAVTYPAIVLADKAPPADAVCMTQVKTLEYPDLADYLDEHRYCIPRASLTEAVWTLGSNDEEAMLERMRAAGVPLSEYTTAKIRRGVVTGLNEAFIINAMQRKAIIAADPGSAALIKPFITGADVKPYVVTNEGKYLIVIPKGYTNAQSGDVPDKWAWLQGTHPALAAHLAPYAERAAKRDDKGDYWWELRACAYYEEFEAIKIVAAAIVKRATFTLDTEQHYSSDKTSILAIHDLYLLGVLNSKWTTFFMQKVASSKMNGYFEQKPMYLTQIPIPPLAPDDPRRARIVELVSEMIRLKRQAADPLASMRPDVTGQIAEIDAAIDRQVAALYGL